MRLRKQLNDLRAEVGALRSQAAGHAKQADLKLIADAAREARKLALSARDEVHELAKTVRAASAPPPEAPAAPQRKTGT